MTKEICDYEVRCKTCYKKFTTQLFESHEKNLWLVDKKDWYCETCKIEHFEKQTSKLAKSHAKIGFPTLIGTPKRVSWAEKIRADLINKVSFLKKSLVFNDDKEKETSDLAFSLFLQEWQEKTDAKWWIDNRKITVRNISDRIKKLAGSFE
ncbi:hypothetical protein [Desulfobacula sp.]|uniref:hypothetical protein n=1 Tax=Desulfobacula sp. TaxID=2593537 RepID=UPI0025BF5D56|nr:hypothetical protein [Desulfobacula sp.]MBC2705521.1 hypothetical protein [Desulfobacula sp.]